MVIKSQDCSKEEKTGSTRLAFRDTEDNLKILLSFLSILQLLLLLSTFVIRQHMSGRHLTESQYALQQVVVLFGELLSQLVEACLTHTYRVVFRFCKLKNIDYLVLRYFNTGAPPFEEWAEEWLHDGEI
jgi:hypothetical protein